MSSNLTTPASDAMDQVTSYRPLHSLTVVCVVLGLLSLLSFAPFWPFLATFPPAAIVTGLWALRRIQAAPEEWAGEKLARFGIGLAVACALGSIAAKLHWKYQVSRYGRAVSERFVQKLRGGEFEAAFWLTMPKTARAEFVGSEEQKVPGEFLENYGMFRMEAEPTVKQLTEAGGHIEFQEVEKTGIERGSKFAQILYRVHSDEGESHLLIVASSIHVPQTHEENWYIREHQFNYTPKSFTFPKQSGHGHAH